MIRRSSLELLERTGRRGRNLHPPDTSEEGLRSPCTTGCCGAGGIFPRSQASASRARGPSEDSREPSSSSSRTYAARRPIPCLSSSRCFCFTRARGAGPASLKGRTGGGSHPCPAGRRRPFPTPRRLSIPRSREASTLESLARIILRCSIRLSARNCYGRHRSRDLSCLGAIFNPSLVGGFARTNPIRR